MLEQTPHQTEATAIDEAECLEVTRNDIAVLLQRKPLAGMDMLNGSGTAVPCCRTTGAAAVPTGIPTK